VDPPADSEFTADDRLDVSPDGTRLAFTATDADGERHLWVRALDSVAPVELPQTSGARLPFWSPDGSSVAFFAAGKLKRISVSGDTAQTVCDAPRGRGGTWSHTGGIVVAPRTAGGLLQVNAAGGTPQAVTTPRGREVSHRWPRFLPDGRRFLFVAIERDGKSAVYAGELGSDKRTLLAGSSGAAAFAPGYVLFVRDNTLMAQGFHARRGETIGEPRAVPFAAPIDSSPSQGAAFAASADGVLAYRSGTPPKRRLTWFDRAGKLLDAATTADFCADFALSPDGKTLACTRRVPNGAKSLWLIDLARDVASRFTFDAGADTSPVWSPDGRRIAFARMRDGERSIYIKAVNGDDKPQLLFRTRNHIRIDSWSPDGARLVYTLRDQDEKRSLWLLPLTGKPSPFLSLPFQIMQGQISPDGRWMAYVSDESGRQEVYVQSLPSAREKWQASVNGGSRPRWRSDAKELFYVSRDRKLVTIPVGAPEQNAPRTLFVLPGHGPYAVSPDGQRFLSTAPRTAGSSIQLAIGWSADLRR
jgi:Tol biopolymer transport system component